jgi:hypothetical protein
VGPTEPGQIDERFNASVTVIHDGRVEQSPCALSNVAQQLVERRRGESVCGQTCVRLADRAVRLSFVMPNETFS